MRIKYGDTLDSAHDMVNFSKKRKLFDGLIAGKSSISLPETDKKLKSKTSQSLTVIPQKNSARYVKFNYEKRCNKVSKESQIPLQVGINSEIKAPSTPVSLADTFLKISQQITNIRGSTCDPDDYCRLI